MDEIQRVGGPMVDTFTAVHKDEIDAFYDRLNEQNADIQFTKEIEENGELPFLDCLLAMTTMNCERQCTENRRIPTDYLTNHPTTRLHKRATKNGDANNHFAVHHQLTSHNIDWDSAQCLIYNTNYFQRMTLESWYTNLEQTSLNRCQQLPAPYKRLILDENKTTRKLLTKVIT